MNEKDLKQIREIVREEVERALNPENPLEEIRKALKDTLDRQPVYIPYPWYVLPRWQEWTYPPYYEPYPPWKIGEPYCTFVTGSPQPAIEHDGVQI